MGNLITGIWDCNTGKCILETESGTVSEAESLIQDLYPGETPVQFEDPYGEPVKGGFAIGSFEESQPDQQ